MQPDGSLLTGSADGHLTFGADGRYTSGSEELDTGIAQLLSDSNPDALDAREMEEHAECVGAPVFGADGGLVGAVSVSTLYREAVNYEELGMLVLKKARQLSEMLGYIRQ